MGLHYIAEKMVEISGLSEVKVFVFHFSMETNMIDETNSNTGGRSMEDSCSVMRSRSARLCRTGPVGRK